jgi:hypothetical protein
MYGENADFTQTATMGETAPFEAGVGTSVTGEFHVDGTPMRLATFVIVGVLILVIFNQGGFRFHVTV